jgi:hypothetical protein
MAGEPAELRAIDGEPLRPPQIHNSKLAVSRSTLHRSCRAGPTAGAAIHMAHDGRVPISRSGYSFPLMVVRDNTPDAIN